MFSGRRESRFWTAHGVTGGLPRPDPHVLHGTAYRRVAPGNRPGVWRQALHNYDHRPQPSRLVYRYGAALDKEYCGNVPLGSIDELDIPGIDGRLRETLRVSRDACASACWNNSSYCSFAYSAWACFRIRMSGSASFQRAKKSWYAVWALAESFCKA